MPDNTGAIIGASAELAGTALQTMATSEINKRAERYNWEMWNVQRQAQIQDWWRTQAYNSPQNQMELYRQAGLNPRLIYGAEGGFQGSSQGSPPSGQSLNLKVPDYSNVGDSVSKYFNVQMQQQMVQNQVANNDLIKSQTNKNNAEADAARLGMGETTARTTGLNLANKLSEAINSLKIQFEQGAIEKQSEETKSIVQNRYWQILNSATSISEANTRMIKNMAETGVLGQQAQKLGAETLLLGLHGKMAEMENAYAQKYGTKMPQQNQMLSIMTQLYEAIQKYLKPTQVDVPKGYTPLLPGANRSSKGLIRNPDGTYYQP